MSGEILKEFPVNQNRKLRLFGHSFLWQDDALERRFCWAMPRTPVSQGHVEALRTMVNRAGFKEYLEVIERIAESILFLLGTSLHPISIIGFGFTGNYLKQLKLYYTLYAFKSEDDIMGTLNDELAKEAVMAILDELNLHEQKSKVLKVMQVMQAKRQRVAVIGLNIEKQKKPGLKIYFEPSREETKGP